MKVNPKGLPTSGFKMDWCQFDSPGTWPEIN